jgi:hypothetical protein
MRIGFRSIADEAFFILGLNPEQNLGIQHSQFFQIARFVFKIFHIAPIIIHSRIIAFLCTVFSLSFFSIASYRWLNKKGKIKNVFGLYLSLVFLSGLPMFLSSYEISLTFNHLLVLSVACLLSFYLLWDVADKTWQKFFYLYIAGIFSFLAIMNYFPSGILLSLTILFLILITETVHWKNKAVGLFVFIAGLVSFAAFYNFFIYSLENALNDIVTSIKNPAFGTGRYDMQSYLFRFIRYAQNFVLISLSGIGFCFMYYLSQKQKQLDKKKLTVCIFVVILVFLMLEARLFKYNILFVPILLSFVFYHLSQPLSITDWLNKKQIVPVIRGLIFLFFPVIALQGTNVHLNYKLAYVVFIWMFVLANYLFQIKNQAVYKFILYLTVTVVFMIGFAPYLFYYHQRRGITQAKYKIENNKMFKHVKLQKDQIEYFQRVDSLLKANHFDSKKDRVLAFDCDYAVLLYLNVTNYGGLMHKIYNMPYYEDYFYSPQNAPEYIIVPQYYGASFKEIAEYFEWNYPDECTEYEIGYPDMELRPLPRSLLIKKKQ